jgi:ABC-type histidine transport system ATPase subunit
VKSTSDDDEENLSRLQKAYQEFESTSLRQQVSTVEKLCGFPLKIAGNPRNSASFALKPDSEKVSYWTQQASFAAFFSGGQTRSPV